MISTFSGSSLDVPLCGIGEKNLSWPIVIYGNLQGAVKYSSLSSVNVFTKKTITLGSNGILKKKEKKEEPCIVARPSPMDRTYIQQKNPITFSDKDCGSVWYPCLAYILGMSFHATKTKKH